jgi:arginyl-tRNA synthetase
MQASLKSLILDILKNENLPVIEPLLREIPFEGQLGLALSNVFQVARAANPDLDKKELKKSAISLAELIAGKIRDKGEFDKVEAVNGYVNCFFKPPEFARDLISKILDRKTAWAKGEPHGGRVMVEYSQPNTHKAFHIGHVRNVVTGAALVRCFRYSGRDTIAANYYGDIGNHVFKSLWYLANLKSLPDNFKNQTDRGRWLGEAYTAAESLLSESEELWYGVWDKLKPISEGLHDAWSNDEIAGRLRIDPLIRKIALKEEDLFENRSKNEVSDLILKLAEATFGLADAASETELCSIPSELLNEINELRNEVNSDNFRRIWLRHHDVAAIAERWNNKDQSLIDLWNETKKWSFEDFYRIYKELDAEFDIEFFESKVEDEGLEIVSQLVEKGVAEISEGAKIVEIDKRLHERFGEKLRDKYRVMVLVRADGASLYGAKDLALAKRKFEEFAIEESIYVVGNEQKFYFQQLFQVLRLMGFPQWENCFHLSYELVMLPSGKISSRKGQVILYDDVIDELRKRALAVVMEKNPGLDDAAKRNVAEMVAMGALIFGMLRVDTNKKIKFDFDEVLDFDGRSAPYIQYAGARALSILRKAVSEGIEIPEDMNETDFSGELLPVEIDLLGILARLPSQVKKVVEDKKPVHVANYAYDLAVKFSDFYHRCPVLTAEAEIRRARLLMVKAVRINLEISLGLLGIRTPDVM